MVKPHFSAYSVNQATMLNTVFGGWYTVKLMFCDWSVPGVKKISKLFLLLLSPVYLVLLLGLSVLTLAGYLVNFVPFVNFLYAQIYLIIWSYIAVPIAMLINIHSLSEYAEKLAIFDQSFFI